MAKTGWQIHNPALKLSWIQPINDKRDNKQSSKLRI